MGHDWMLPKTGQECCEKIGCLGEWGGGLAEELCTFTTSKARNEGAEPLVGLWPQQR